MRKILRGHVFIKIFLFTLCLGSSFLFEVHAQVSGTFTINSGAAPSATNFQSFSAAAAFLSAGVNGPVIFNVQAGSGPYNEQVLLDNIAGTSAANTITFNCNGVTLSFLSTNYSDRASVKLRNTDYVTFDNLTVLPQGAAYGEYAYGFHLLNDADHNTISNCRITILLDDSNRDALEGIVINGNDDNSYDPGHSNCDDNLIRNNIISGGNIGISLSSQPPSDPAQFMTGNRIINNTISNFYSTGIQLYYTSGTVVDGNEITGGPAAIGDLTGVNLGLYNQSITITKNRIHGFISDPGSLQFGIFISSEAVAGKEILIANNLIYDFQCEDGSQYGIASMYANFTYSGNYLNIYHNTISFDDKNFVGTETFAMYFEKVTDVNVVNNIITITRQTSDWNYGLYFETNPERVTSQRNLFYIPDGVGYRSAIGRYNASAYESLRDWQLATSWDYSSLEANPLYTNLAVFDLKPTAQTVDNMGMFLSDVTTDITGAVRSTTRPDVGCFEFTSAACSPIITGGSTGVLPDSILCFGPSIALSLSGHSAGDGQTYTWQTSTTATGTYTDVTGPIGFPYYEIKPTTTLYYRAALTCGTAVGYSAPIRVLVNTTLNGGTYTINSALPTGGINFNSFRDASLALQCGFNGSIVFNAASGSGPYSEQVIIPAIPTSPTKTVTFNCNGVTLTYAPTNSLQSAVFKLDGADYITIDSLNVEVKEDTTFGYGIQLKNDADYNIIRRCTINLSGASTSSTFGGIVINGVNNNPIETATKSNCDTNLVESNKVIGGFVGISCTSESDKANNAWSIGNIIRNNTVKDAASYGIFIAGTSNTLIDSNDISQPERTVFTTSFHGIHVRNVNLGTVVSANRIYNLSEKVKNSTAQMEGIHFEKCTTNVSRPSIVINNVVYGFKGTGWQYGIYAITSNHTKIYHNTVSLDDTASTSILQTRAVGLLGALSQGVEVKNNNIVVRRGGNGQKYCFYIQGPDSSVVANYNNYYMGATTGSRFVGIMFNRSYATLNDWLATRKDSASISIDPVPHDPAIGDFTPTKIPFENRGTSVNVTNDIWDVTRNTSTPDIGAFEFTICRQLTNPVLTADSVGINAIRFSWPDIQYTTGYRVSRDGINWTIPSSGARGLTHTIAGLKPGDTVGLMVKALGSRVDCPEYFSQRVVDTALADGIYVPNTFTPNGNGRNDEFKVYSNVMKSIRWMVFNQWGEKVFETTSLSGAWDGMYKGKPQPIGVYVFVVSGTLSDGTKVTQKGTFNLIR